MANESKKKSWWQGDASALLRKIGIGTGVSRSYLKFFYVQMGILLTAGCTILESLRGIASQVSHAYFREVLLDVAKRLEQGKSFADSLRAYPKIFPEIFCSLVSIGEQTGTIEGMVTRFAESEERSQKTRSMVMIAMIYPTILLLLSAITVTILMVQVFPKFMKVITIPYAKLPLPTRMVMVTSDFFVNWWLAILVGSILFVAAYIFINKFPRGKKACDWLWLRFWPINGIFIKGDSTLFCRTLAIMLKAGLPIVRAVGIVKTTVDNTYYMEAVADLEERISRGDPFTRVLRDYPTFFNETTILMCDVGERTGNLDNLLLRVADYLDEELQNAISFATSMLEPLLIIFVACVVGVITSAMFLPLFEATSGMR